MSKPNKIRSISSSEIVKKKPITRKSYYWDFGYHGNIDFLSMNEMEFAPDRLKQTAGT